jgi:hypothetical protein
MEGYDCEDDLKIGFEVLKTTGLLDNECFIAWLGSASLVGGVEWGRVATHSTASDDQFCTHCVLDHHRCRRLAHCG